MEFLMRRLPRAKNISTGDGFRRISGRKNLLGRLIKGILDKGDLVPYWGPVYVWLAEFFERLRGDESIILDGAPRRVEEAKIMDDFMRDIGRPLPLAIYLKLSESAACERLLRRGRADDNLPAIRKRFIFFKNYVRPVIRYYKSRGRLIVVDGDQNVEVVRRDIDRLLREKLSI